MEDLIYNQRNIPRDQWRYGFRTTAATGCGWIATYNALRLMNYKANPESLIYFYEWQVPFVHGNLGTLALGPAQFFKQHGFQVRTSSRISEFDDLAKDSDVCLLFYYWRKGAKFGAHFVALHHKEGQFIGYNTYKNSTGPDRYGPSLAEFIKKQKYFGPVLIAIKDKR